MLSYVKYQVNSETSIQILKINQVSSYKHQNLNLQKVLWKMKIMVLKRKWNFRSWILVWLYKVANVQVQTLFHVFQKCPKEKCPGKELSVSEEDTSKIWNTLCVRVVSTNQMTTHIESICCLDKYEIRENYLKGIFSFVLEIFLPSNLLVRRK